MADSGLAHLDVFFPSVALAVSVSVSFWRAAGVCLLDVNGLVVFVCLFFCFLIIEYQIIVEQMGWNPKKSCYIVLCNQKGK